MSKILIQKVMLTLVLYMLALDTVVEHASFESNSKICLEAVDNKGMAVLWRIQSSLSHFSFLLLDHPLWIVRWVRTLGKEPRMF